MSSTTARVLVAIVMIACLAVGAYVVYFVNIVNPAMIDDLTHNPAGARARKTMILTFADGKRIPVNYLLENDTVFVGADFNWWRQFEGAGSDVEMLIQGTTRRGHGVVVLNDPEYTRRVFARLRPDAPAWLPDWLNGKLIVVTLADGT